RSLAISPRGDRIYLIEQSRGSAGRLHAWSIDSPSDGLRAHARDLNWALPLTDGVLSLALRPDGAILAIGDRTGTVTLVDTARHSIVVRIKPQGGEGESFLLAMTFSPDGRDLAVGSPQGKISLWSVVSPAQPRLRFNLPGHRGITGLLAFDPGGHRLASADFN